MRREIHVALLDPRTDTQSLYPATILHSGLLAASNATAGGISFSPRRCAYRKGQQFPTLLPSGPVDQVVLNGAEYFVTVRLGALAPSLVAVQPPARAAVMEKVADDVSPLLARLDADAKALLFGGREIRVRRPGMNPNELRVQTAVGRNALTEHPLVGMRILAQKTR